MISVDRIKLINLNEFIVWEQLVPIILLLTKKSRIIYNCRVVESEAQTEIWTIAPLTCS